MTDNASGVRRRAIRIAALAFTALAPALLANAAHAQTEVAEKSFNLDIPAQTLARSMATLSTQTGLQVVYADDAPLATNAPAVKGRMTVEQALARLTVGTGFTYRFTGPGVVTLVKVPVGNGADGEVVTGVVSVEGVQGNGSPYFGGAGQAAGVNGTNGSRDITATEGTGSFTSGALTIGSKVPQALRDVPQSVSVLTSARLEQQNVTDFTTAMKQLPGITLVQGTTSLETDFYSRGFAISNLQVDGGAPLSLGYGFYPQIDMSVYDHVELLRGADGLMSGYGDPSGTVNLVRKKPLDHAQYSVEAQAGSWSNYRVVADATSPLALDGKLRGRLVMTYQDNHYFYDTAKDNKNLIYGIAEFDATPTTLITVGINYTKQDSIPWSGGLPRYLNGDDLKLPRSTSFVFPWNRWDFDTLELFAGLEQKIGSEWNLKVNITQNRQNSTQKIGYSSGAVNPNNAVGPMLIGTYNDQASKQLSTEAVLSGAFILFGQRQEVTVGASRVDSDSGGRINYASLVAGTLAAPYQPYPGGPLFYTGSPNGRRPPIDVFDFDSTDPLYTEPRGTLPSSSQPVLDQLQWGAYLNLRLTAFDRLHLTTGLRWSRFAYKNEGDQLCTITTSYCAGKAIGDSYLVTATQYAKNDFSWPPPVNVSFDITRSLTAYVGYTDIYRSQAYQVSVDKNPLPPITGSNWEAGLKWAAADGRLNLSVAAYRIQQDGFGIVDPDNPDSIEEGPGVFCCYVVSPDSSVSKGIDFEVTGELHRGWQISASYVYSENEQKSSGVVPGTPFLSIQPKHLYKLWMSYDFGAAGSVGALSGLTLSGGLNGQSSGYRSGSTCVRLDESVLPDALTGAQPCLPDGYEDYHFTVPAYALLSGRIDYRLSEHWSLAVNLENILDKTYYQTAGLSVSSGNWYGAPRSVTASIRAKW